MQLSMHISVSGQVALAERLDTIAHNIANIGTAGFRASEVKFESLISPKASGPSAFVSTGETFLSRAPGALANTGNALDVAVKGSGWFGLDTPEGPVYTRDGRMRMTTEGGLESLTGHAILDAGGAQIVLDPQAGETGVGDQAAMPGHLHHETVLQTEVRVPVHPLGGGVAGVAVRLLEAHQR